MSQAVWRSPAGERNARALRLQYAPGFEAFAEFDRIGHLLLHRASITEPAEPEFFAQILVGVAMLRRAVTLFTGIRTLLEASLPDVAKAPARAYFELWLQHQVLAYGPQSVLSLETPTLARDREQRALRYYVAAERRMILLRSQSLYDADRSFPSIEHRDALEKEFFSEIARLRNEFPAEWDYFGDVTPGSAKRIGDDRAWFEIDFGAPPVTSIAALARRVGKGWEYQMLYGPFSALMHSRGVSQDLTIGGGSATVHHPHSPTWFQTIAWFTINWHRLLLTTAAKWHFPEMIPDLQEVGRRAEDGIASLEPVKFPNLLD